MAKKKRKAKAKTKGKCKDKDPSKNRDKGKGKKKKGIHEIPLQRRKINWIWSTCDPGHICLPWRGLCAVRHSPSHRPVHNHRPGVQGLLQASPGSGFVGHHCRYFPERLPGLLPVASMARRSPGEVPNRRLLSPVPVDRPGLHRYGRWRRGLRPGARISTI